jgi:hypothetical protein
MNAHGKFICLVLATTMVAAGVLTPVSAAAQSPSGQPDMYQEALKASPKATDHAEAYRIGAAVASVFSVPGRAILCGIGAASGVVLMVLTFGSGYGAAKAAAEEGCGGTWVVTAEDLRAANAQRGITPDAHLQ